MRACVCVQVRRGRRRKCVKTVPPVPAKGRVVTLETVEAISISISIDAAFCGYQKLLVRFFLCGFCVGASRFPFSWVVALDGWVVGWCFRRLYKFPFSSFVPCCSHSHSHSHWRCWHSHAHAHYALSTHTHTHSLTQTHTQRVSHPPPGQQATGAQFSSFFFGFTFYHRLVSSASVYTQHLHTRTEQRSAAELSRAEH